MWHTPVFLQFSSVLKYARRRFARFVPHAAGIHRRAASAVHRVRPEVVGRLRDDTAELFVNRLGPEHRGLRRDPVRRRFVPSRGQLLAGHGHDAALSLPPSTAARTLCL